MTTKTLLFLSLFLLSTILFIFSAGQTDWFQTWAAKRATSFLSKELGTKVEIDRLSISFVKNVTLEGIYMEDKHHDTIVYGKSITVDVSGFNFKEKRLNLDKAELTDVKVKLLKYTNEDGFNYQFLADYFSSTDTTVTKNPWKIKYGALTLNNVDFTYRLLRDTFPIVKNMNFNNLHVSNIYGSVSDIDFKGDSIYAQINGLSAKEQSGFVLKNLTTKAKIAPNELKCDILTLQTECTSVFGQLQFKYNAWEDYQDFINKVYIKAVIKDSSKLCMKDVTYFAEDINGFNEIFGIKGNIRGFVNDLNGSKMDLKYGDHTRFKGDISITGLPDFNASFIHFDAEQLSTTQKDLESFPLPPFEKPTFLSLPKEFGKLGIINYKGNFDGNINDFVTYGTFNTAIGSAKTDLHLKNVTDQKKAEYDGKLTTTNLNISKLFPSITNIGAVSLTTKIKGKGFDTKQMKAQLDGTLVSINFNNYLYKNIKIDGLFKDKIFKGNLVSKDPNADFDFSGAVDLNYKVPKMDFISTVNNFDLEKTHFSTPQLNGKISSQILINLNGDNIGNLSGQINFDGTIYKTSDKEYTLNTFNLELDQNTALKNIKLNSSIANAQLTGKFNLSTLPNALKQYLHNYFPTFVKSNSNYIYRDRADLTLKVKNFKLINELFTKDLKISPNTLVNGSFDASINYLYLKTNSDLIEYTGLKFKQNDLTVNSLPNGVTINYQAKHINLTDSFAFDNPSVNLVSNDKHSSFDISWNNQNKPRNSGAFTGNAYFDNTKVDVIIDKTKITLADSTWQLVKGNIVTIDTSYSVKVYPITLYNNNQLVTLDGTLSKKTTDKFNLFIQNIQLSQFNGLLSSSNINLNGTVSGNTTIYSCFNKPVVNSDIDFNSLKFNTRLIGSGKIKSEYNPEKEYVSVNGYSAFGKDEFGVQLKNIEFDGLYFPKKATDNIDLKFKTEPLDLSILQPYFKDIMTIKVGYLNGSGTITGSINEPQINARLKFMKCVLLVDFLNVQYNISGDVEVKPNQINFDNLIVSDRYSNAGTISGNIFHSNFQNLRIDFDVNTPKLMVLNTTSANNSVYYGTAYASGNAGIYGFLDDIHLELNMKTNPGTVLYIPLDGPAEVNNNGFIQFVTLDTIKKNKVVSDTHFSLLFNLEATTGAEVQLIFDEKSGDIIKARGDGNLSMNINSKGKFDMYGEYVINSGDYLFTLENVVTKKFDIQRGSNIKWNGNVYKANIDIEAVYKQKASVRPIYPADSSGKRYAVECQLFMRDKLTEPRISFGINLPTIDETARSAISSILADETELNRQVFSLLLLRSFVTPIASANGGGGISAGGAAAATGSELLSNKLSNWLNGLTKDADVDVGVNYRPGTGVNNDQVDLTLNKQLFNNRLVIDGNFGVNNSATKNTNSSNLVGDVTLEYKLSKLGKYRVKAFNRSNDNTQILNSGGPFTQGVGIFYREEFENLSDLYKRYTKGIKKK